MISIFILFILAYLIGSIPTAYIYCKLRGKDILKEGSGNVGATNAARMFGKSAFFLIFFLDALKGFIPIYFLAPIFVAKGKLEVVVILTFFITIMGHVWSIFLKFKGGKGVSTSVGGLLAIMPLACLLSAIVFALIFFIKRIVSLGSIFASVSLPIFSWFIYKSTSYLAFSLILCFFIVFTHRSNIQRLLAGNENKLEKC